MSKKKSRKLRRKRTSKLSLEALESKQLLAADLMPNFAIMQNPVEPADVNGDEVVSPLDALEVLGAMSGGHGQRTGRLPTVDVDGNGRLSPLDAMLVMNRLNHDSGHGDRGGSGHHSADEADADSDHQEHDRRFRTIDGTDNNRENADWGSTETELLRSTTADYADGLSDPAGADRASAREISNVVAAQDSSVENDRGLTDLVWLWGQFIDHDIDLTENADPAEAFDIEVPTGDAWFDPLGTGEATISLNRSEFEVDSSGARQQINRITAYLDGSVIYGSDQERADALREFSEGRLLTSDGDFLPYNEAGYENAGGTSDTLFLAGDVRANENAALTSMHTLWVREHNRIAAELQADNPRMGDEQIYQRAKAIVTAELQAITYNEFLPALLGEDAIPEYRGYDRETNSSIANIFSTAAYRFGHSMLSSELLRLNNDGTVSDAGNLPLQSAFFAPDEVVANDIDSLLLGAANQTAQEIDSLVVDDVRNFLFGPPGSDGFDLVSLNIQRGRDHGLPDYNQARIDMGLEPIESFADLTSDPELQVELEKLYGSVDNIDAWVGGLAEDHVPGSSTGEFVRAVLADQFTRIRDGDAFWYQRMFRGQELSEIENTTLADVIRRNTGIEKIQNNVFIDTNLSPFVGTPAGASEDSPLAGFQQPDESSDRDDRDARNRRFDGVFANFNADDLRN